MSAFVKATSILSGLALTGAAGVYALRTPAAEFSHNALAASEHVAVKPSVKKALPSTFLEFSIGDYRISNARA